MWLAVGKNLRKTPHGPTEGQMAKFVRLQPAMSRVKSGLPRTVNGFNVPRLKRDGETGDGVSNAYPFSPFPARQPG